MMKLNKYFMMLAATLAFAACSNDDEPGNGSKVPVVEGQKTWAYFNLSLSNGANTRAVDGTPEAGVENGAGVAKENTVNTVDLYIFRLMDDGTGYVLEATQQFSGLTNTTVSGTDGSYSVPGEPIEVTSGQKQVYAIVNRMGTITATPELTTSAQFLDQVATATNRNLEGQLIEAANQYVLMTGRTESLLQPGISKEEAKKPANSNHLAIQVDRAVAKIKMQLNGSVQAGAELAVTKTATAPGTQQDGDKLTSTIFDVLNIKANTYRFMQGMDDKGIYKTPDYSATTITPAGYLGAVSDFSGKALGTTVYMSENTNVVPKVGNSTYVLIKGTYVPVSTNVVSGFSNKTFTLAGALTTGQKAMYSYRYGKAFTSIAGAAFDNTQIQWLAAMAICDDYPAENDVKFADIKICADQAAYDVETAKLSAETGNASKFFAYKVAPADLTAEVARTKIVVKKWSKALGAPAYTEDKSFVINPLQIALYDVVTAGAAAGLECYYRVNVFDKGQADPKIPMYYSVLRNRSYNLDVTSVSSIGYPRADDVNLPSDNSQDEPLVQTTTYMQVTMTVNQWTFKDMSTGIGM